MVSLTPMGPQALRRSTTEAFVAMKSDVKDWPLHISPSGDNLKTLKHNAALQDQLTRSSSETQLAGPLVRKFVIGALDDKHV